PVANFGRLPATEMHSGFWGDAIKFNPLLRLPEFVAGVLAGRLYLLRAPLDSPSAGRGGAVAALIGFAGIVILAGWLAPLIPLPIIHNAILLPFNVLLIYGL